MILACIEALDHLPGCDWPLWQQYVVGVGGGFVVYLFGYWIINEYYRRKK